PVVHIRLASRHTLRLFAFQALRPRSGHAKRGKAHGLRGKPLSPYNSPPLLAAMLECRHAGVPVTKWYKFGTVRPGSARINRELSGMQNERNSADSRENSGLGPWSLCVAPMMDWTDVHVTVEVEQDLAMMWRGFDGMPTAHSSLSPYRRFNSNCCS